MNYELRIEEAASRIKYDRLLAALRANGSAAVAFSAGVDSSLLLAAAKEALGDRAVAVTVCSRFVPAKEQAEARALCAALGVRQIELLAEPLDLPLVRENGPLRCYHCKRDLFSRICRAAREAGLACVCEGSNADDPADDRPGMRALRELGVQSPLLDAGLTKAEIRALAKARGLPNWNKPALACLATRIPCGTPLTAEALGRVEQAEDRLAGLGFSGFRVRAHGDLARLELPPEDLPRLTEPQVRQTVTAALHSLGYRWVALDLDGYRTGSMNGNAKGRLKA